MPDTSHRSPATERAHRWLEENRQALEAFNRHVVHYGPLSDQAGLLCKGFEPSNVG